MSDAFVIMQIGNPELEGIYKDVIAPAIEACGLSPKRVDKHNKGGLLKSEIIRFIKESEIVVADLTNERPNCYLEVGYAMGWSDAAILQSKLILTCREDHDLSSTNHTANGPKVHFDLSGYDICYWFPDKPALFRDELVKRIRKRRVLLASGPATARTILEREWITKHRETAIKGLRSSAKKGFFEAAVVPVGTHENWSLENLNFGPFPLPAVGLLEVGTTVKRFSSGIVKENAGEQGQWYIYWTCQKDGSLYTLASLPEEMISTDGALSAQRRILQTANLLISSNWFYAGLGLPPDSLLDIVVQQGGLLGRTLKVTRYGVNRVYGPCAEDAIRSSANGKPLVDLFRRPEVLLKELLEPFFEVFGFPVPEVAHYKSLAGALVAGHTALWSQD